MLAGVEDSWCLCPSRPFRTRGILKHLSAQYSIQQHTGCPHPERAPMGCAASCQTHPGGGGRARRGSWTVVHFIAGLSVSCAPYKPNLTHRPVNYTWLPLDSWVYALLMYCDRPGYVIFQSLAPLVDGGKPKYESSGTLMPAASEVTPARFLHSPPLPPLPATAAIPFPTRRYRVTEMHSPICKCLLVSGIHVTYVLIAYIRNKLTRRRVLSIVR